MNDFKNEPKFSEELYCIPTAKYFFLIWPRKLRGNRTEKNVYSNRYLKMSREEREILSSSGRMWSKKSRKKWSKSSFFFRHLSFTNKYPSSERWAFFSLRNLVFSHPFSQHHFFCHHVGSMRSFFLSRNLHKRLMTRLKPVEPNRWQLLHPQFRRPSHRKTNSVERTAAINAYSVPEQRRSVSAENELSSTLLRLFRCRAKNCTVCVNFRSFGSTKLIRNVAVIVKIF